MKEISRKFNGRDVRVIIRHGVEWFVVKDVCGILELLPADSVRSLKERFEKAGLSWDGMVSTQTILTDDSYHKTEKVLCVNEQGLYELIFASKKEEAVRFRAWVTVEVLPSIRKTGKYDIRDIKEKSKENRNLLTGQWKR